MVEILSPCPTNWSMTPVEAAKWVGTAMTAEFPLGEIKNELPAKTAGKDA